MCAPKGKSWYQVFLAETVKSTGAKYRNVSYNIFKRCWPFSERVGPRILLLESVDYFTTSVSGRRKQESLWAKLQGNFDGEANWSGVLKNFIVCISESCDEHAVISSDDWNDALFSSLFCSLAMIYFLSMEPWFSYIYTRLFNQFKNNKIVEMVKILKNTRPSIK